MGILSENSLVGASYKAPEHYDYKIDNSLKFNDDDSAYLNRTPTSSGTRTKWTYSGWVKRASGFGVAQNLQGTGNDYNAIRFETSNALRVTNFNAGSPSYNLVTTRLFRDSSAFYHICVAMDTTQGTASNRLKLYINGVQETSFSTETYPSQNYLDNYSEASRVHQTGCRFNSAGNPAQFLDGYLAEVNFIDGQALTPSNFGEADEDYGDWKPKEYTGTYGTNGFYLDFKTSGTLGNDASSNSNNWTPNNLAATDQMVDTPTNNFATLNPLNQDTEALSEGSLQIKSRVGGSGDGVGRGTIGFSSGKWYAEYLYVSGGNGAMPGISPTSANMTVSTGNYYAFHNGNKVRYIGNTYTDDGAFGATFATGDILGIVMDADNGTISYYKNNSLQGGGSAHTGLTDEYTFSQSTAGGAENIGVWNFGQDSSFAGNKTAQGNQDSNSIGDFYYAPPTDFLALCSANLPDPTVIPSKHFNTVAYTGTGATRTVSAGLDPDLVWIKRRDGVGSHLVYDKLRMTGSLPNRLWTDIGTAESTTADGQNSFSSTGIVLDGSGGGGGDVNTNNRTYVAWNWKAGGGTAVSNTNGTITSSVSANVDAGFSIVTYTGNGSAGHTVGHGLSKTPDLVMVRQRNASSNWMITMGLLGNNYLSPTTDEAIFSHNVFFNNTLPDSTKFTVGSASGANANLGTQIAYCFHNVDGYSKFGSYTGNGSADGPFVHLGFRPAYVMVKNSNAIEPWPIHDNARSTYNTTIHEVTAESSALEATSTGREVDFLSNGFKVRNNNGHWNGNGNTMIFLAFAEMPFKWTNAR